MAQTTIKPNPKFAKLWRSLTPAERDAFAKLANSTAGSLRQIAEGNRRASVELAARMEKASAKSGGTITRVDLNPVCKRCPFAQACQAKQLW